jgi:hypothetical protein
MTFSYDSHEFTGSSVNIYKPIMNHKPTNLAAGPHLTALGGQGPRHVGLGIHRPAACQDLVMCRASGHVEGAGIDQDL